MFALSVFASSFVIAVVLRFGFVLLFLYMFVFAFDPVFFFVDAIGMGVKSSIFMIAGIGVLGEVSCGKSKDRKIG